MIDEFILILIMIATLGAIVGSFLFIEWFTDWENRNGK